jgi:GFO/IDH/MocA oxidoreductase family protein
MSISRRYFFFGSFAAAVPLGGWGSAQSLKALGYKSPNEKLNIAGIGAGGRPFSDLVAAEAGVENVVALTDVDWVRGAQGFSRWPKAEKYRDFRQMIERQGKGIDAVVIGTADHMHATCALWCMQAGKHVYVEKPLTRTPWEARLLTQAAEKYKVATQMGNQGYSHDATRVACEILWSGEIGEVREVHAWHGGPGWPQGMQKIPPPTPVPDSLDWDLWLGGAAARPYTAGDDEYRAFVAANAGGRGGGRGALMPAENAGAPAAGRRGGGAPERYGFYLPFNWRGFHDFGSTLFGDWGVHILGPANWGLRLGPESLIGVERLKAEGISPFTYPIKNAVKYEFAARGSMPPVTVYWSDSIQGDEYLPPGMTAEQARKIPGQGPQVGPAGRGGFGGGGGRGGGQQSSGYNLIFVGSKGYLGTSGRGEGVGLLPGARWAEYKLPNAYLQRSPGASTGDNGSAHARDWVRACKGGAPACSNFSIAGPYTEWLVMGAVATHYEGKLLWDNARGEITNNRDANKWVKPTFRKGWEIKL